MENPDDQPTYDATRQSQVTRTLPLDFSGTGEVRDPLCVWARTGESLRFRPADRGDRGVPLVLSAAQGFTALSGPIGLDWPRPVSSRVAQVARRLERRTDGAHMAFLRLAGAPRPLVLVASDQSAAYRSGHRSWFGGKVWRDWYYAVAFSAFAGVDEIWRAPVGELVHPTGNGWSTDLAPSVVDGLVGLLEDRPLALHEVAINSGGIDAELTPIREAIATIAAEPSSVRSGHRSVDAVDLPPADFGEWDAADEVRVVRVAVGPATSSRSAGA